MLTETELSFTPVREYDLSPDAVINKVQRYRLELLDGPDADLDKNRLKLMADLSNTALGVKRIATEDTATKANREVAAAINASLQRLHGNPFVQVTGGSNTISVQPPELPPIDLVPDEDSRGIAKLEFNPESLNSF